MYRSRNRRNPRNNFSRYRRNHFIKAPKVLVIDEQGEKLGEMTKQEALRKAQEADLDLVEVAPNGKPPVCKIISWSKFKYQLDKRQREARKSKAKEMKEMRFQPFIGEGDLEHKLRRTREFLAKKHPVKITVTKRRGRVERELLREIMEKVLTELKGECKIDQHPRMEGRNFTAIIRTIDKPKKESKADEKAKNPQRNSKKSKNNKAKKKKG